MPCPPCGTAIGSGARFCGECGEPLARLPAAFRFVGQDVDRLRAESAAIGIDAGRLQAALRERILLHEGRWWMVGADSGQWYVHEGVRWVASATSVPG